MSSIAQSNKIDVHGFKKEYELEKLLNPIDIQGQIWQAHAMASDGEHVFVVNDKEVPPIKSYRLSDGKFMGGFGSIGGGPGEFVAFNRSGFGIRKEQLVVQGRKYIRIFDIKEKSEELDFQLYKEVKIPGEFGILNHGFMLNDNEVAGGIMFSPKDFVTIKLSGLNKEVSQETGHFGDYPNIHPEIPTTALHHLYYGNTAYAHDGNFLVKAYSRFPMLRVFDLRDGSYQDLELEPKNKQVTKVVPDKRDMSIGNSLDMFSYQGQVKISDDFIVSDYQETIYKKVAMTERGNLESVPQTDKYLLVIKRTGELLAKLSPPEWFQRFILTPENKMILFHPEIENKLFVVDLEQFRE